ncbi:MAG: zinc-finger domain-containing protein [Gammaproteobacteria bacterium]|nr:zinc-finger domain-containing protein [Gammaproteobacteria bacterium]
MSSDQQQLNTPNAQQRVEITAADLPLHCPQPGSSLWNSHPKVYLEIEHAPDNTIICPYCGTEYHLKGA